MQWCACLRGYCVREANLLDTINLASRCHVVVRVEPLLSLSLSRSLSLSLSLSLSRARSLSLPRSLSLSRALSLSISRSLSLSLALSCSLSLPEAAVPRPRGPGLARHSRERRLPSIIPEPNTPKLTPSPGNSGWVRCELGGFWGWRWEDRSTKTGHGFRPRRCTPQRDRGGHGHLFSREVT
jgi:hypothetical protein